jgi:hypothetical protein
LKSIIAYGGLVSDAAMVERGGPEVTIGMSSIKRRRLRQPVPCHPGTSVGDYVPFYFCRRSIMLYLIYCGNHPDLTYRKGQRPILHLEANLYEVVDWADEEDRQWAFSLSNAGARYTEFRASLTELDQINWPAVAATDFRAQDVKEGKQAEFLVHEFFPWDLVTRIGVHSANVRARVEAVLGAATHRPKVEVRPDWYY